jgi:hypothetical protein
MPASDTDRHLRRCYRVAEMLAASTAAPRGAASSAVSAACVLSFSRFIGSEFAPADCADAAVSAEAFSDVSLARTRLTGRALAAALDGYMAWSLASPRRHALVRVLALTMMECVKRALPMLPVLRHDCAPADALLLH